MQSPLRSLYPLQSVEKAPSLHITQSLCTRECPPRTSRTSWQCMDDPWLITLSYHILENVVLILQVLNGLLVPKFVDFLYRTNVSRGFTPRTVHLTFSPWAYLLEELIVLWNFPIVLVLYHVLKGKHCIKCDLLTSLNRFYWLYTHFFI